MTHFFRSSAWRWFWTGLLLGCGCGWVWRQADVPSNAPSAAPTQRAAASSPPTPSATSAVTAPNPEQSLRDALAGNRLDDVRKWIVELAKRDGVLALRLVLGWQSKDRDAMLDHAIYHAASHQPDATAELVFATPELRDNAQMVTRMFAGITRSSVAQALTFLSTLAPAHKDSALRGIGREWARIDWRCALEHGLQMQPIKDRDLFMKEALGIQAKQGFGELALWMKSLPANRRGLIPIDWNQVKIGSPQDFALAMELMPSTLRDGGFSDIFQQLHRVMDATPANRAWIDSLPKGETRDRAFEAFVVRASQVDPESAQRLIQEGASSDSERSRLTSTLVGLRAFDDPQAALAYADALPDPHGRAAARVTAMGVMGLHSPQQGLEMLIKAETEWTADDMRALAVVYTFTDPVGALEAGLRMKNEANRNRWVGDSFGWWFNRDAAAASAWANQLPPGSMRDRAYSSVADHLKDRDPSTAMIWAQSIADANKRFASTKNIANIWSARSSAEWQAWLAQSTLDEQTRQQLLKSTAGSNDWLRWSSYGDGKTVIFTP